MTDRLAAYRQQQQQQGGGGGRYGEDDYGGGAGGGGGGYSAARPNPYAQRDDRPSQPQPDRYARAGGGGGGGDDRYGTPNRYAQRDDPPAPAANRYAQRDDPPANRYAQRDNAYEMAPRNGGGGGGAANGDDLSAFYDEVQGIQDAIRSFNENVASIGDLQSRSLNNVGDGDGGRTERDLERLVDQTSSVSADIKRRVQALERKGFSGPNGQTRKQQTAFVKSKFVEAIQNYQQVEQQYRTKSKQRIERQYKIVKPDATPEEVRSVVNDEQGGQIFAQALMNSNRYGESRQAYREVQERHADIKKIEKTLTELAQLFQDMSVMVEQQDETINVIQNNAVNIDTDVQAGYQDTEKAVVSARGARKKRWICFFLTILIIVIIVIAVLFALKPWQIKK